MSFIIPINVISLIYKFAYFIQLFERRKNVFLEGEEKDKFMQSALDYMSEESSESEGKDMVVHKPAWRSRGNVLTD